VSQHELQHLENLVADLKAANKKWALWKLGGMAISLLVFMFWFGVRYENWNSWRTRTDQSMSELKTWKAQLEANNLKITQKGK
jgi:hypothetical protein